MFDALSLSKQFAQQNQAMRIQRSALAQEERDRASALKGTYRGFDADLNAHIVSLPDGGRAFCNPISNGGIEIGQNVNVSRGKLGWGVLKVMPR